MKIYHHLGRLCNCIKISPVWPLLTASRYPWVRIRGYGFGVSFFSFSTPSLPRFLYFLTSWTRLGHRRIKTYTAYTPLSHDDLQSPA